MPSSKKPAVVMVHGGFTLPETYDVFLVALSRAGFVVRCPRLPTSAHPGDPKASLTDDVVAVRKEVTEVAQAGHPVILLAHSWGGFVASEAMSNLRYMTASNSQTITGLVKHITYLSAWMLAPLSSVMEQFTNSPVPSILKLEVNNDGTARVKNVEEGFYNDIEASEEKERLTSLHVEHNFAETKQKATVTPWEDVPTTFVYCEQDLSFPLASQKQMVMKAIETVPPKKFSEASLNSGHFPFCSMPNEVVRIVQEVWNTVRDQ